MKELAIVKTLTANANKFMFKARKHSPEILIVTGVVGFITSGVLACRATLRAQDILKESRETVDAIKKHSETEEFKNSEEYSEKDVKRAITLSYAQTGLKLAKEYAPAVILAGLSVTSVLSSHNILRKRNVALAAAYATVDKSFKKYRDNVIEKFGEAVDKELRYSITKEKVEKKVVDEETGKEKKVKEEIEVSGFDDISEFAKWFDEKSRCWEKNAELNLAFLRAQEKFANDKLRSQGYLFLSDVYEMLDIEVTKASRVVGWLYRPDDKNYEGDNYVDFGLYNAHRSGARDFVNGLERSILLDFNVDGPILDYFD